jgi:hypothetical protein
MDLNKVNIGNIQPSDDEDMGDDSEKESKGVGYGSLFKLK